MSQLKSVQDMLLTNVSNKIQPMGYVSDRLLTPLKVKMTTGKIGTYGNGHMRVVQTLMGGKGKAPRVDVVTRSSDTYSIDRHGLEGILSPDDFANAQQPFDARSDEVDALTTMLWSAREKGLGDALTDTSVLTNNTTLSGTDQYNDFTNSDPLGDFITARAAIRGAIGLPPNKVVMDWLVADTLRYHPGILDALGFKDNRAGQLTDQDLARALAVDEVLVAKAVHNSGKLGQADVIAPIWGKHMVWLYAPKAAQKMQKTLGYNIEFAGRGARKVFRSAIDNPPESERIVVVDDFQQFLSDVTGAYLIKDAIA